MTTGKYTLNAFTTGAKLLLIMFTKKLGKHPIMATAIMRVAVDKRSNHTASVNCL